ncbi:hypothetical protein WICMUC_003751 [Wickerhamomyces mucosus]|uniref:Uncharacterized protein n=1 Tax=Wickerhamomyces mucosus TaxID=1378264 RepID=A0A9P8TBR7_9ASCO|nr:hypothetical protein WICMUC_003751 [Wickerhamomyces mucosus]
MEPTMATGRPTIRPIFDVFVEDEFSRNVEPNREVAVVLVLFELIVVDDVLEAIFEVEVEVENSVDIVDGSEDTALLSKVIPDPLSFVDNESNSILISNTPFTIAVSVIWTNEVIVVDDSKVVIVVIDLSSILSSSFHKYIQRLLGNIHIK